MNRKSLLWHIFLPFLAVSVLSLVLITGYTSRSLRGFFYDQTHTRMVPDLGGMSKQIPFIGACFAIMALASLGYKPAEVNRMIGAVTEDGMDAEEIIRKALQMRIKST
mgnify:CR=1 FL=1